MKPPNVSRVLQCLAIAVSGLVVGLPLLALDCEMSCARGAAAASVEKQASQAEHCPAHGAAAPTRSPADPVAPDGCGHHADCAVVKKTVEGTKKGCDAAAWEALPSAMTHSTLDRKAASARPAATGASARPLAALPRVLRL